MDNTASFQRELALMPKALQPDQQNTVGDTDFGTSLKDCEDGCLDRGYSEALPAGARRGRTDESGNDYLDYELPEKDDYYDDLPVEMVRNQEERDRERMHGGFVERPGLEEHGGRTMIKRI